MQQRKISETNTSVTKTVVTGILTSAIALAALAGCNRTGSGLDSDPTQSFGIGEVTTPHGVKAREQVVLDRSYIIEPEKDATFSEGETGSFSIRVRFFQKVDKYNLKIDASGDGVQFEQPVQSPTEPGTWVVTWAAPKGFVPSNLDKRDIRYKVELADIQSSDADVEKLFRMLKKDQDFSVRVIRTAKRPEIKAIKGLAAEIVQGTAVQFTVDVFDPSSYDGYSPRLDYYFQGTNKTESGYEANGATYVRVDAVPKHIGNGVWRFSFVFDARNNDVGAQLDKEGKRIEGATHLNTRFMFKAYGAAGGVSGEQLQLAKIKYLRPQVSEVRTEDCSVVISKAAAAKKAPAKPPMKK